MYSEMNKSAGASALAVTAPCTSRNAIKASTSSVMREAWREWDIIT